MNEKIAFVCDIRYLQEKSGCLKSVYWLMPKIGFVVTNENEKYFKGRAISKGQRFCFEGFAVNSTPTFEFFGFDGLFKNKTLAKVTIEILEENSEAKKK